MKARILYVEDDPNLAFATKDNLEVHGYDIVHCTDGQEGLEAFRREHFDLCVLDVMLPEMDGFTLAQRIRETDRHIPILFLTAAIHARRQAPRLAPGSRRLRHEAFQYSGVGPSDGGLLASVPIQRSAQPQKPSSG